MSVTQELNKAIDQAAYIKNLTYGINMAASHLNGPERDAMQVMLDDVEQQLVELRSQLYHTRDQYKIIDDYHARDRQERGLS